MDTTLKKTGEQGISCCNKKELYIRLKNYTNNPDHLLDWNALRRKG